MQASIRLLGLLVLKTNTLRRHAVAGATFFILSIAVPALGQTVPAGPSTASDQRPPKSEMPLSHYPQPPLTQRLPPILVPPPLMPPRTQFPPGYRPQRKPTEPGPSVPPVVETVSLSGPRFGYTALSEGVVQKLKEDRQIEVGSLITQFGWQFEKQFYSNGEGLTILNEWVGLIGGLEQSLALPSLSWLVGFRTKEGAEFGLGPNLTPAGVALAVAGGVTFRVGAVNIPLNVAVVPSKAGVRVSMLTGFSLRTR
jgi:hypothetical protein